MALAEEKEPAAAPVRILPLKILSDALEDTYTGKLGKRLETVLRRYSNMETLPVPEGDVLELLLEHDCIEPDLECLATIGKARKVDLVFFATVTSEKKIFTLGYQVVDVKSGEAMKEGNRETKRKAAIMGQLKKIVADAFGEPPPPPPPPVAFSILSPVLNARVTLDGKTIGMTPLNAKVPPGKYKLSVEKKGYETFSEEIRVKKKRAFRKRVKLRALAVAVTEPVAPVKAGSMRRTVPSENPSDSKPLYKEWWVWAGAGAVVVGGIITAVVLSQGGDSPAQGSLQLSLQPDEVESDAIFSP